MYQSRGFSVTDIHGDSEFNIQNLHNKLQPINFHIYAPEEHVHEIERGNRTFKEKCRTICHALPYRRYPKVMLISLAEYANHWINAFPPTNGVSSTISPANIVLGRPKPNMSHQHITFGSYAFVFVGTKNNMKHQSIPAIALRPANDWGGHYFLSLITGKRVLSFSWKEIPIDDDVVSRVHELAEVESQPLMPTGVPYVNWGLSQLSSDNDNDGIDIGDSESVSNSTNITPHKQPPTQSPSFDTHPDEQLEIVDDGSSSSSPSLPPEDVIDDESVESDSRSDKNDFFDGESIGSIMSNDSSNDYTPFVQDIYGPMDMYTNQGAIEHDDNASHNEPPLDPHQEQTEHTASPSSSSDFHPHPPPTSNTPSTTRYPQRNRQPVDRFDPKLGGKEHSSIQQTHLQYKQAMNLKKKERMTNRNKICLMMRDVRRQMGKGFFFLQRAIKALFLTAQMNARKGIKLFKEKGIAAMIKEFTQLDQGAFPGKPVVEPLYADSLTEKEIKMAMEAVNILKEKRNGIIKGRTCANGSRQRRYLKPEDSVSSPTVSTEGIIGSFVIDTYEDREIAVLDIPGAYLHADMQHKSDARVILKLQDEFVDYMCTANPKYKPYVTMVRGKKTLYLKLLRALYGCIESALLWYNLFSSTLINMGFEINPYDRCIANKNVNGSQCTIVWYVDDAKISHKDASVVKSVVDDIQQHFGKMNPTFGKSQEYLGMKVSIDDQKRLHIDMRDQICEIIDSFSEDIGGTVSTPAQKTLMEVNPLAEKLSPEKGDIFHSTVAKLLYLEKRARPDLETAVSFLTTRVSDPDVEDWKKLRRVLVYLNQTKGDVRVIGCDSMESIFTWVDASFAVHHNMRSHTGGIISMGWGAMHSKSSKQKINTKSSTEAEIVGLSEYVPYNIWLINFLKAQGYSMKSNTIYQDNQSAIRMAKNGRNSCTGNSRHIDIRYFFVKDRVDKGEMDIKYCPTGVMLADYFTKPFQGQLFNKFRNVIMGFVHISSLNQESTENKEREDKSDEIKEREDNPL